MSKIGNCSGKKVNYRLEIDNCDGNYMSKKGQLYV